jgi:hypothetical protein
MPNIPKVLFRGAATTNTATTLYTTPSSTTTVITNIVVTNTSASAQTFTMALAGTAINATTAIAANSSAYIDVKQVLATTNTITGGASATSVNFHISGMEIS